MEKQPTTFTRKTRTRQIILGVLVVALIVALVVAVIVLAILLDRKKIDDRDGGDEVEQVRNRLLANPLYSEGFLLPY